MSGTGNVGQSSVYEAGDQRNYSDAELEEAKKRFKEGKENSHKAQDPKDERTIANKLERELKRDSEDEPSKTLEDELAKKDATLPAKLHGNEPSKGAIIDQQIREEEEEILKKKGSFGPKT